MTLTASNDYPVSMKGQPLTELSDLVTGKTTIISSPVWCEYVSVILKAHDGTYPWCPLEFQSRGRKGLLKHTGTEWKVFYEQ